MNRARTFRLDASAIALARPSAVLALDPNALGRIMSLPAERPGDGLGRTVSTQAGTVAFVAVSGPLAQHAIEDLCGYVDGYDAITARLGAALEDEQVGAVVLVIDSPGGDAAGVAEATRRMRAAVEASGKPVFAYVDELAASAAYWLASGVADEIHVPPSGLVGSIGTLAVHFDESRRLENMGVHPTIVRDPEGKAAGNYLEPLSAQGREEIESIVRACTAEFVGHVARARGLSAESIRELNGKVLRGQDAVSFGLADSVSSLEDVIAQAHQRIAMKDMQKEAAALVLAPEGASEEQLTNSLRAAGPIMALGRAALEMTGAKTADAAAAQIAAWKVGAEAHAKREADEAAQAADHEKSERFAIVSDMVASGKVEPARARMNGAEELTPDTVAEPFASGMTLEVLRATAGAVRSSLPKAASAPVTDDASASLTAKELAYCKARGIAPADWARSKARISGANAAPAEG